jgi:hypothetical protein
LSFKATKITGPSGVINAVDIAVMVDRASNTSEKSESIDELLDAGAEIAGGVAGTALGLFAAGPAGAFVGGVATPVVTHFLRKAGIEIKNRLLGPREEVRVGATLRFAAAKIQENLDNGYKIRQDEFFKEQPNERAPIEEVLEGVLLAAQREHEEKKLGFYGTLVANLAFHPEIDRTQANFLIRLGERISYCQMCLIALFVIKDSLRLRQEDYKNLKDIGENRAFLLQEIYELYSQRLLDLTFDGTPLGRSLPDIEDLQPARINVTAIGKVLYKLMELAKVNERDLNKFIELLSDDPYLPHPLPVQEFPASVQG